jgi:penicillin-insensitive murein endopeptidase
MKKYFFLLVLFLTSCAEAKDWGAVKTPTKLSPAIYGSYTEGCLDGAAALPMKGKGYEVVNGARNRFYGHPTMIDFLQKYAAMNNKTIYISDVSQARGGPIPRGHGSHQVGLDADIWYGKNGVMPVDLANKDRKSLNEKEWQKFDVSMLQNIVTFPEVERVFVDPVIKRKLCEGHKGEAWLNKIRPWRYHSDHLHVRIACPLGDKDCQPQNPVEKGDGCDATLDWWFSAEAEEEFKKPKQFKPLNLPKQCDAVFAGK